MDFFTAIASFASGLLCSMGFGGGSVLIIFLTSYLNTPQKEAQGINLFFFIPCALYSIIKYSKDGLIIKDIAKPFIFWGIVGVGLGYGAINLIPSDFLGKIFGGLLIIMGLNDLFSNKKKRTSKK